MWLLMKPHVNARAWWYAPAYCLAYLCNPSYSYFVFGAALHDLFARHAPTSANGFIAATCLAAAAGACFIPLSGHWTSDILQTFSVAGCFAALAWSPRFQCLLSSKLSTFLGRISFSLYLCHVYVLRATLRLTVPGASEGAEVWGFENFSSPLSKWSPCTAAIAMAAAFAWATVMTVVDWWAIRVSRRMSAWACREETMEFELLTNSIEH